MDISLELIGDAIIVAIAVIILAAAIGIGVAMVRNGLSVDVRKGKDDRNS